MYLSKVLRVIQIDPLHAGWTSSGVIRIADDKRSYSASTFPRQVMYTHLRKPFVRWVNHRNRLSESWKTHCQMRRVSWALLCLLGIPVSALIELPYLKPPPFSWTDSQRLPFLQMIRLFQRKGSDSSKGKGRIESFQRTHFSSGKSTGKLRKMMIHFRRSSALFFRIINLSY